ncbi:MAG: TetR/AcrR family transcriptional regulator [Acidobacteriota bacterium]
MLQNDPPSRSRLFSAARKLFAEHGYESTSTSSIARAAGTSESQLIKHFGGKAGLLEAIFVDGWEKLRPWFDEKLKGQPLPVERLRLIPRLMVQALEDDPDFRLLLLLEGRRVRREGGQANFTDGFAGIATLLDQTLAEMKEAGELRDIVTPQSVRAALIGLTEGAMRDQLLAERAGHPAEFTVENIGKLTDAVVESVRVRQEQGSAGCN